MSFFTLQFTLQNVKFYRNKEEQEKQQNPMCKKSDFFKRHNDDNIF